MLDNILMEKKERDGDHIRSIIVQLHNLFYLRDNNAQVNFILTNIYMHYYIGYSMLI